ncbi:hypothetical protein [Aquibacillus halophilus]|nr:hypothetical protein [Aquibacillus halophilus]
MKKDQKFSTIKVHEFSEELSDGGERDKIIKRQILRDFEKK